MILISSVVWEASKWSISCIPLCNLWSGVLGGKFLCFYRVNLQVAGGGVFRFLLALILNPSGLFLNREFRRQSMLYLAPPTCFCFSSTCFQIGCFLVSLHSRLWEFYLWQEVWDLAGLSGSEIFYIYFTHHKITLLKCTIQ